MNIKTILDKAIPITPGDKGCRFKLAAKNQLREEIQKMIEQYAKELPKPPTPPADRMIYEGGRPK